MERILATVNRAVNSNAAINAAMVGIFGVLATRSFAQQRVIEGLEVEKESLVKTNKRIKSTIWEWRQKLFAEAEANSLVPLSTLKSIYGEAVAVAEPSGDEEKQDAPAVKIMV